MRIEKFIDIEVDIDDFDEVDIDDFDEVDIDDFDEVDIDDFDTDELIEALGDKDLADDDRKELLRLSGYNHLDIVREEFESSNSGALNVLQDLLGMQHTTTKEQVLEQLKTVL